MNGIRKNKVVAVLLVMATILGIAPGIGFVAASAEYSSDFVVIDGVLKSYMGNSWEVEIPNGITEIGDDAFRGCDKLTSVNIPNSVTRIGDKAFFGCNNLTSVDIPNSVTSIGDDAFFECKNLTSIVIPNSVTSIGDSAFYGCKNLTNVNIPNSVTCIGNGTFIYCKNLTSVTISNPATTIYKYAFDSEFFDNLTIYAPAGSGAEQYAKDNNIAFSAISFTQEIPVGNDPAVGSYVLTGMTNGDITINTDQMAAIGIDASGRSLEIRADGRFSMSVRGTDVGGTWANNEDNYILTDGLHTWYGQYNASDMTFLEEIQSADMKKAFFIYTKLNASTVTSEVSSRNDPAVGTYVLSAISTEDGVTIDAERMATNGLDISDSYLEISANGMYSLKIISTQLEGFWKNSGNTYLLTVGTDSIYGQYNSSDMIFTLEIPDADLGILYNLFTKSSVPIAKSEAPVGNDPAVGSYVFKNFSMGVMNMSANDMAASGSDTSDYYLEINADGSFFMSVMHMTAEGTWEKNGNDYLLKRRTETMYGQYNASDMTFSFEMLYMDISKATVVFSKW